MFQHVCKQEDVVTMYVRSVVWWQTWVSSVLNLEGKNKGKWKQNSMITISKTHYTSSILNRLKWKACNAHAEVRHCCKKLSEKQLACFGIEMRLFLHVDSVKAKPAISIFNNACYITVGHICNWSAIILMGYKCIWIRVRNYSGIRTKKTPKCPR